MNYGKKTYTTSKGEVVQTRRYLESVGRQRDPEAWLAEFYPDFYETENIRRRKEILVGDIHVLEALAHQYEALNTYEEATDIDERFIEALATLTEDEQNILYAHYGEALSYRTIAELNGWASHTSARKRTVKALEALREALGGDYV